MKNRIIQANHLAAFTQNLRREEKSAATIEKYSRDVAQFVHWAGQVPVTKALVAAWKEALPEKGYAPATVNGKLTALDRFLTFWGWEDCRVKHVTCQRKLFREDRRELTREEYFRLVNAASGKLRLMLLLETICATGIRVSEVKYTTLEAARQGRAEITLKGKVRTILLPGKLCRKLLKYARKKNILSGEIFLTRGGKRLNRKNIWAEMKALCPAAGVAASKVFPHNLRHLFAKCFYDACRDLVKLADVLGHSSVETTRIYLLSTGTQHVKLLDRLGLVGETETAQRPSASVIEAADAMREVAGNVAQNNCIHCADAHDACHGKSDRKTGWADRETRAAPEAFLG